MQLATEISVYRPAIIYVFINAGPSFGGDNPAIIMEALSRKNSASLSIQQTPLVGGAQINVICTQTKGPGNSDYYKRVTTASNGRYVWVTKDDIKPVGATSLSVKFLSVASQLFPKHGFRERLDSGRI